MSTSRKKLDFEAVTNVNYIKNTLNQKSGYQLQPWIEEAILSKKLPVGPVGQIIPWHSSPYHSIQVYTLLLDSKNKISLELELEPINMAIKNRVLQSRDNMFYSIIRLDDYTIKADDNFRYFMIHAKKFTFISRSYIPMDISTPINTLKPIIDRLEELKLQFMKDEAERARISVSLKEATVSAPQLRFINNLDGWSKEFVSLKEARVSLDQKEIIYSLDGWNKRSEQPDTYFTQTKTQDRVHKYNLDEDFVISDSESLYGNSDNDSGSDNENNKMDIDDLEFEDIKAITPNKRKRESINNNNIKNKPNNLKHFKDNNSSPKLKLSLPKSFLSQTINMDKTTTTTTNTTAITTKIKTPKLQLKKSFSNTDDTSPKPWDWFPLPSNDTQSRVNSNNNIFSKDQNFINDTIARKNPELKEFMVSNDQLKVIQNLLNWESKFILFQPLEEFRPNIK